MTGPTCRVCSRPAPSTPEAKVEHQRCYNRLGAQVLPIAYNNRGSIGLSVPCISAYAANEALHAWQKRAEEDLLGMGNRAHASDPGASAMDRTRAARTCEELPILLIDHEHTTRWPLYVALAALMVSAVYLVWP